MNASPVRHFCETKAQNQSTTISADEPNAIGILWRRRILNPKSDAISCWNNVFFIACLISHFIDPLYFYVPFVKAEEYCINSDTPTSIKISHFRNIVDIFYILNIIIKSRMAFVSPSSRVSGHEEIVFDPKEIKKRYLKRDFILDLIATLPLPQIVVCYAILAARTEGTAFSYQLLQLVVLAQYIPRLSVLILLSLRQRNRIRSIASTAWAITAYHLLRFLLVSHLLGACWYLGSIHRKQSCWEDRCVRECRLTFLDCWSPEHQNLEYGGWRSLRSMLSHCDVKNDDSNFEFGIYAEAFTHHVASPNFVVKLFYGLWWGLRNLSSYGQNLVASTEISETSFCILLSIIGLVLVGQLIGDILYSVVHTVVHYETCEEEENEEMRHGPIDDQKSVATSTDVV